MLYSLSIAIIGIVSLMLVWTLVQSVWKKLFADHITDEDVLAERRSCGNCGCGTICQKKTIEV